MWQFFACRFVIWTVKQKKTMNKIKNVLRFNRTPPGKILNTPLPRLVELEQINLNPQLVTSEKKASILFCKGVPFLLCRAAIFCCRVPNF